MKSSRFNANRHEYSKEPLAVYAEKKSFFGGVVLAAAAVSRHASAVKPTREEPGLRTGFMMTPS